MMIPPHDRDKFNQKISSAASMMEFYEKEITATKELITVLKNARSHGIDIGKTLQRAEWGLTVSEKALAEFTSSYSFYTNLLLMADQSQAEVA